MACLVVDHTELGAVLLEAPGSPMNQMLPVVLLLQGPLYPRLQLLLPHAHLLHHLCLNGLCLVMVLLKFNVYSPK